MADAAANAECAKLLDRAGAYFYGRAAYAGARPLYERALAIREKALGPEHPDTATSLNNLALLLLAQGDLAAARPLYERALAIREKVLGPDHPYTATGLNNLAGLLQAILRRRGRSSSARWRSARRRSAPSIPIRRRASTTSPACLTSRAISPARGRFTSARWRSARRRSARSIPQPQPYETILQTYFRRQGNWDRTLSI
jgi:tetratricopeptide (TPR) repeat protein